MELYLPGLVPKESIEAHFQVILPLKWRDENHKPICVHLAGTGDHVRICLFNCWPMDGVLKLQLFLFPVLLEA